MARLPENASLELQLDYLAQALAGLGSLDETAPLGGPFEALAVRIRAARDERDQARWKLLGKSARVRVFDARWDSSVSSISGQAYLLAGKDANKDPYNVLFGRVKADDARKLGPSKAEAFGSALLTRIAALGNAVLDALAAGLRGIQAKLMEADQERDAAYEAAISHEVVRRKLLREVEDAADHAEVGILTAFPGERALVNAILVWRKPAKAKEEAGGEPDEG